MARFKELMVDDRGFYIVVDDQTVEVTPSAKDKKTAAFRDRDIYKLIGNAPPARRPQPT